MKLNSTMATVSKFALSACLLAMASAHANTVYTVNQSGTTPEVAGELSPLSDSVTGTITTDGTIGVLQSSNIVSFDLLLTDAIRPGFSVDLTPANAGINTDVGNGLSATAMGLSFDFSLPGAEFAIQGTTFGFNSGYQYFCFQATTGSCAQGETIVPNYYATDGVLVTGLSGVSPLDPTPAVPAVPEPSIFAMLGLGFAGLGLFASRRKSRYRH